MNISVKMDDRKFRGMLKGLEKDIPKAQAISLTFAAQAAQKAVKDDLEDTFLVRRGHILSGIRITGARAPAKMFSEVGSIDDFMVIHALGSRVRRASTDLKKSGHLAVPFEIRKRKKQVVPRTKWPGKLVKKGKRRAVRGTPPQKPQFFVFKSKRKRAFLVAKRTGKKTWKKKKRGSKAKPQRAPIRVYWALLKETRIPKRWMFFEVVGEAIARAWPISIERAIKKILAKRGRS